jgi:rRNA biogenesis protein RRP5
MKILGQILSVQPLALLVSLPNQLFAHVPITNVSTQLTASLEAAEEENEDSPAGENDDEVSTTKPDVPDLTELFRTGEYIRAVVTAVHEPGSKGMTEIAKTRDPIWNASRRVELSLAPDKVNIGVQKTDLRKGFVRCCPQIVVSLFTFVKDDNSCRQESGRSRIHS